MITKHTKNNKKLKCCPDCKCSENLEQVHILSRHLPYWYYIECPECYYCGPTKLFLWRARWAWNRIKR